LTLKRYNDARFTVLDEEAFSRTICKVITGILEMDRRYTDFPKTDATCGKQIIRLLGKSK
jgi:hypothetical protein